MERYDDGTVVLSASLRPDEYGEREKGYMFTTRQPSPLRESLDDITLAELQENSMHFKKLKENWYIFLRGQY